jgi:hypothetical protein
MSIVGWVVIIIFTSIVGLAVGIGLFRMLKAAWHRDWPALRYFGFLVIRVSLVLAGGIILIETRGHGANLANILVMVFCLLQLIAHWPPLKAFIGEGPRRGSV